MNVYLVRYSSEFDGEKGREFSCGNFEYAENDEATAIVNMLEDLKLAKKMQKGKGIKQKSKVYKYDGKVEGCELRVTYADGTDAVYTWWVDKLKVA